MTCYADFNNKDSIRKSKHLNFLEIRLLFIEQSQIKQF
jgi:hypothetical protein